MLFLPQQHFRSHLPQSQTTIFSRMSMLAAQHNAINLGQGFPDFACDPALTQAVHAAMQNGFNQYPLSSGVPPLRQAIAEKLTRCYGATYNADTEITVTAGATQALFIAILCCVHPGDEVIIIEPAYDSYIPVITLAGGIVKPVPLTLKRDAEGTISYSVPVEAIAQALTPRTRLIIINTPHNPTGTVWSAGDMLALQEMLNNTSVLVCSDEVYEHIIFDGVRHESIARYPDLASRSFVISSFGKSFHVTGWKVGYVAAPAWLTAEFRKLHQFNVFTVNSPAQYGIAKYMQDATTYLSLPEFYQQKRDYFAAGLAKTPLRLLPSEGTYFQCVEYARLTIPEAKLPELEFAEFLTRDIGVAAIPVSAFYSTPTESGVVRFCFAKKQDTLSAALERLAKL